MEELHKIIRSLRKAKGISQAELAKTCGITQGAIASIESGKTKNISIQLIIEFAKALKVNISEFLPNDPYFLINTEKSKIDELQNKIDDLEERLAEKDQFIKALKLNLHSTRSMTAHLFLEYCEDILSEPFTYENGAPSKSTILVHNLYNHLVQTYIISNDDIEGILIRNKDRYPLYQKWDKSYKVKE